MVRGEEEAASYFSILIVPTSYSWDEEKMTTIVIYGMLEDYWYHKATKANVSTSEPIFVDSKESTDTLPMGKKEERQDYVTREVEELRRYMKGKHIDAENWSLRYPDPCPQQGSGDDCAIFTCKYMECLARRDTQGLPFSQDDMPNIRAKFALHFIKVYFNAQERS
ncbi:hypothetical protein Taro_039218 [Colocasia esculenta]|uniref:Ubiquitin-like protease family profile domain-containing protein n=1 Tax=Colocasia esculenta TaxID=4460 RepID=A0A843WA40_COLES|nr:hypothetical protein [Colocasia esculenta]